MSNKLVDLLQQTIDSCYKLDRQGNIWLLQEASQPNRRVQIRSKSRHTFAFSLDHRSQNPLAFFSANPPDGIKKMCDAIMACHYKNRCYLLLIEMKTQHKNDYKKQITNGKLFCDWLLQLYQHHDHTTPSPVFVSLLIWFPQNLPPREGTAHRGEAIKTSAMDKSIFDYAFEIQNQTMIPIFDLLEKIS